MRVPIICLALGISSIAISQPVDRAWARAGESGSHGAAAASPDEQYLSLPTINGVRVVLAGSSLLVRTIEANSPRTVFLKDGGLAILDRRNPADAGRKRLRIFSASDFSLVRTLTVSGASFPAQDGLLDSEPVGDRLIVNGRMIDSLSGLQIPFPAIVYGNVRHSAKFAYSFGPVNNTLVVRAEPASAFLIDATSGAPRIAFRDASGWFPAPYAVSPDLASYVVFNEAPGHGSDGYGAALRRSSDGSLERWLDLADSSVLWKKDGSSLAFTGGDIDQSYGVRGISTTFGWTGHGDTGTLGAPIESGFVMSGYGECQLLGWQNGSLLNRLTWGVPGSPLALSPDGKTIVIGHISENEGYGFGALIDAQTGAFKAYLGNDPGTHLAWASNDRLIVGSGLFIRAFRADGTMAWEKIGTSEGLIKLSASRDGRVLAAWKTPNGVLNQFIDQTSGQERRDDGGRTGLPGTLSRDGSRIVFGGEGRVKVTDSAFNLQREWTGVSTPLALALSPAPRGGKVAVGSTEGIYLGDIATGEYRRLSPSRGSAVAFTREGGALLGSEGQGGDMRLKFWSSSTGSLRKTWTEGFGAKIGLAPAHLVAGEVGTLAYVGSNDGAVTAIRLP